MHRIGRTGRNGADGVAITLCDPSESAKLRAVERVIRMRLQIARDHTREPDPRPEPRALNMAELRPDNDQAERREDRRPQGEHKPRNGFGKRPVHGKSGEPAGERKPFRAKRKRFGGKRPAARAA